MLKILCGFLLFPAMSFAFTLTNNIEGVGPGGLVKPYICIPKKQITIAPGETKDVGRVDYIGAAVRFYGCSENDSYLGWLNIHLSDKGSRIGDYIPPEGVHIVYANPGIDSSGHLRGNIAYSPIVSNDSLIPAQPATHWDYTGVNLSGLEFGKVIDPTVIPNLSLEDSKSPYSDLNDTESFLQAGMNTIRVPVSWGYLQLEGAGKGSINMGYYANYIRPLLQTLTKAKVHTIIDLHAYMRYSKFGEQYSGCSENAPCPDGTLILDENAYQSVWGQLMKLINEDSAINKDYIILDLMNEPVDVPDDKVFSIQASLIKMLRVQGFHGMILVEGNHWTGLHSWTTQEWVGADGKHYTNATLFTRENFEKAGIRDLSNIVINVHQYLDSDYSGTKDTCLQDLNTTGQNGFNLQAFTDYLQKNQLKAIVTEFGTGRDAASCSGPLNDFMQYLKEHSARGKNYGFVGWTIWSSGHGWGNYNLRVKPDSYHMQILHNFL